MQNSRANISQVRSAAAFVVLFIGAVLISIAVAAFLLNLLYSWPLRPGAALIVLVALIGFSVVRFIAPSVRWATFREGLTWSVFLAAFAAFGVASLGLPRARTRPEIIVLLVAAPLIFLVIIYSWRHRRR